MRSLDELATEICTLAGHINAAAHRFLVLIAGDVGLRALRITPTRS